MKLEEKERDREKKSKTNSRKKKKKIIKCLFYEKKLNRISILMVTIVSKRIL